MGNRKRLDEVSKHAMERAVIAGDLTKRGYTAKTAIKKAIKNSDTTYRTAADALRIITHSPEAIQPILDGKTTINAVNRHNKEQKKAHIDKPKENVDDIVKRMRSETLKRYADMGVDDKDTNVCVLNPNIVMWCQECKLGFVVFRPNKATYCPYCSLDTITPQEDEYWYPGKK